jgi:hypothetical protein
MKNTCLFLACLINPYKLVIINPKKDIHEIHIKKIKQPKNEQINHEIHIKKIDKPTKKQQKAAITRYKQKSV